MTPSGRCSLREMSLVTSVYVTAAATSYVLPLYYFNPAQGDRDDLHVVKSRMRRITAVTLGNLLLAPFAMTYLLGTSPTLGSALEYLGIALHWHTIKDCFRILLLFCGLFIGPIVDKVCQDVLNRPPSPTWSIYNFRDIIFAPLTEEIIFTAICTGMYSPLIETNPDLKYPVVMLTPFLFGIAHLHHGIELLKLGYGLQHILLSVIFQLLYTTFFGVLTNLIFSNSKSVWCCFAAHAFCNSFGVPKFTIVTDNNLHKYGYWLLLAFGVWFFRTRFDLLTLVPPFL